MLELSAAPSPVRTAKAANAGSGPDAPAAEGIAADGSNSQAAAPFAAVLQQQLKKAPDSQDAKPEARPVDVAEIIAEPPADAFAVLASMLTGIAPAQPGTAPAATDDGTDPVADSDADSSDAPATALIAPAMPAIAAEASRAATPATPAGETPDLRPAPAQAATQAMPTASAILAADTAATAERSAENGKNGAQQQGFDALLAAAARETQIIAGGQHAAAHAAPVEAAATNVAAIATPVGARGWDQEVGQKLTWMVGRQESRADLVLNPPQLGRIEVSISMNGDQANAIFASPNPTVREALEQAMPRLREILQDAGISLGQTQVGAESFQQSANKRENGDNHSRGKGNAGSGSMSLSAGLIADSSSPRQWLRQGNGMVDTFA